MVIMDKLYVALIVSLTAFFFLIRNFVLFYKYRKGQDTTYKIMTVFLGLDALNELACNVYGTLFPGENLIITHSHYQLQFLFCSMVFYSLIKSHFRKVIVLVTILFYAFVLYHCYQDATIIFTINIYEIFLISAILIIYALYYLYYLIDRKENYINFTIGLIMYLLCSSIVFFYGVEEIVICEKPFVDIWVFSSIFLIIYQLLIYRDWKIINKLN